MDLLNRFIKETQRPINREEPIGIFPFTVLCRPEDPLPSIPKESWITPTEQLSRISAPILQTLSQFFPKDVACLVLHYGQPHPIFTEWHEALVSLKILPDKIPPLPEDIHDLVERPCPISGNKQKIYNTHHLILVLPDNTPSSDPIHWELMTKYVIDANIPKIFDNYSQKLEFLGKINQTSDTNYEIPSLESIAAVTRIQRLFPLKEEDKYKYKNIWVRFPPNSNGEILASQYPVRTDFESTTYYNPARSFIDIAPTRRLD